MADYLILGGGLAGCVLASRLKEHLPRSHIVLVEAGPYEQDNACLNEPKGTLRPHNSAYQYNYRTAPQAHYDNRELYHAGGKVLSGSSSINYATWTRGDRADYDLWAKLVNDSRWSYEGQLPYFRNTEHHYDPSSDPRQHGFEGPIHTAPALSRSYSLTVRLKKAFLKIGVQPNEDANSGNNKGLAPRVENLKNGKRQTAGEAYGLRGVDIITESTVKRIILQTYFRGNPRAIGVELTSGRILTAKREVILCCGAIRTPQVLMVSGIGPRDQLNKHNIRPLVDSPEVGQNYHEHLAITQFYKIKNSEKGTCTTSSGLNHSTSTQGLQSAYLVTESAPTALVKAALEADGEIVDPWHPQIFPPRSHYEILPMHGPREVPLTDMRIPLDSSILSVGIVNLLPTSRGRITLKSADPTIDPVIDPNYFATHTDRVILRAALRRSMSAFETRSGRSIGEAEIPPQGYPPLSSKSADYELDARIRRCACTFFDAGGTASMGRVVDTRCRVIGTQALRVIDASVIPTPISAHYQVAVYALAEQMADIVAAESKLLNSL